MPIFEHLNPQSSVHVLTTTQAWGKGNGQPLKVAIASIGLFHRLQEAGDPQLLLETGFKQPCKILWSDPELLVTGAGLVCPLMIVQVREGNNLNSGLKKHAAFLEAQKDSSSKPDTFNPQWNHSDDQGGDRFHSLNHAWNFEFDGHAHTSTRPASFDEGGVIFLDRGADLGNIGIVVDIEPADGRGFFVNLAAELARPESIKKGFADAFHTHIE